MNIFSVYISAIFSTVSIINKRIHSKMGFFQTKNVFHVHQKVKFVRSLIGSSKCHRSSLTNYWKML